MKKAVFALMLALTAGCVRKEVVQQSSMGVGPSLVVEQFMRAANGKDLEAMGALFGTKEGPVVKKWPRREVEQRMFLIATELQHSDFQVTGEQMVPGRTEEATQLLVQLTKDDRKYTVPFTLVRYGKQGWLIEQIKLDVLTAPKS